MTPYTARHIDKWAFMWKPRFFALHVHVYESDNDTPLHVLTLDEVVDNIHHTDTCSPKEEIKEYLTAKLNINLTETEKAFIMLKYA